MNFIHVGNCWEKKNKLNDIHSKGMNEINSKGMKDINSKE